MDRKRAFIINFAYFAILLLLAFVLLRYGLRLLMPFVVGGIVAALLQKPIRFLAKYLPLPKKILALLVALLFFCTIGVLISILSVRVFTLGQDIALSLPTLYREYVEPLIRDIFALLETSVLQMDETLLQTWEEMFYQLLQSLGNMISSVSVRMVGIASSFASSLPGVFIRLLFFVIATFFMTMDYDRLTGFLMRQMSERVQDLFLQIKSYIVGTLFVCIRSYALNHEHHVCGTFHRIVHCRGRAQRIESVFNRNFRHSTCFGNRRYYDSLGSAVHDSGRNWTWIGSAGGIYCRNHHPEYFGTKDCGQSVGTASGSDTGKHVRWSTALWRCGTVWTADFPIVALLFEPKWHDTYFSAGRSPVTQ